MSTTTTPQPSSPLNNLVVGGSSPSSSSSCASSLLSNFHLNVTNSGSSQPPHYTSLIGKSIQLDSRHYSNVVVEEVIAEGGFGVIFLVKSKVKYALKRVVVNNERDYANVCMEVAIMSTLSGKTPHVLSSLTHVVHQYGPSTYEVQNLMPLCKQNLLQVASLRMSKNGSFDELEILQVVHQVATGLQYLHTATTPPILHRDIKLENILILPQQQQQQHHEDSSLYVLSDFGSATTRQWDPNSDSIQQIQDDLDKYTTLQYRSPEMVDLYGNRGVIGVASDVWALGVCVYKMMCFKDPFESILAIQNRNLNWTTTRTKYCSELVSFAETLMAEFQVVRPNCTEVIKMSSNGLNGDWSLVTERVALIQQDLKGREELSCNVNKDAAVNRAVVLETSVTPRQRPKRGVGTTTTTAPPPPPPQGSSCTNNNNNNNNGSGSGSSNNNGGSSLPPPLAPPKSPKPVSPGETVAPNNNRQFFTPSSSQPQSVATISPIPPPSSHLTPSPSPQPQPQPPQSSWNPFDEDYQPPPPPPSVQQHHHQHCDNDSIQKKQQQSDEEDDPFANAPFDYFKYQPIMVMNQQQGQQVTATTGHYLPQQQPYYAANNPFLYDVHSSSSSSDNNIIAANNIIGVCNLSFDDNNDQQVTLSSSD